MFFELLAPSLRAFHRAVASLARLCRDIVLILRAEELVLHGADDAHSALMQFAFRAKFFRSTPASLSANSGACAADELTAVVGARALLSALKGSQQRAGQTDTLILGVTELGDGEPRLVLEYTARCGGTVRHRVPLNDGEPVLPGDPAAGPHTTVIAPALLARVLDHCSPPSKGGASCEEVTLTAVPREGLRIQSFDLMTGGSSSGAHANRTQVMLHRQDLEAANLDPRGGEVTFSGRFLRDFSKAAEGYARDLEALALIVGTPVLEVRFGVDGGSVVCRLAASLDGRMMMPQDFAATLILAIRQVSDEDLAPPEPLMPQARTQGVVLAATQAGEGIARNQQQRTASKRRKMAGAPTADAFDAFNGLSATQGPPKPQAQPQAQAAMMRPPVPAPAAAMLPAQAVPHSAGVAPMGQLHGVARSLAVPPSAHLSQVCPQAPLHVAAYPPPRTALSQAPHLALSQPHAGVSNFHQMSAMASQVAHMQAQHLRPAVMHAAHMPAPARPMPGVAPLPAQPAMGMNVGMVPGGNGLRQALVEPAMQGPGAAAPRLANASNGPPVLASQLHHALDVADSDDELLGADPDEVALERGDPAEESVDWFDVERVW